MTCAQHCELKFVKVKLRGDLKPTSFVFKRIAPPPKPGEWGYEWAFVSDAGSYPFADQELNKSIEQERDRVIRKQQGPFVVQGCGDGCKCFANEPAADDKSWIINTDPPPVVADVIRTTVVGNENDRWYQVVWQVERKFAYVAGDCDEVAPKGPPSSPEYK